MKLIFLDIDGVINTHESMSYETDFSKLPSGKILYDNLSYYAIEVLNDIIKETNAKVVISSSWRLIYPLDDIRFILNKYGFVGEVIGITPDIYKKHRGEEIKQWLRSTSEDVESYLVLDDDCDMSGVLARFLWIRRSKGHFGLSLYHREKAIKILKNKAKFNWLYNCLILIKPSIRRKIFKARMFIRDF